jgi:hypothetical protein
MSQTAWSIFDQIYTTWSAVWVQAGGTLVKIWYSQVGEEERWIPLNGNQARVMRAAIGHGFLNLKDEVEEDGVTWGRFRMTGEGNRCFEIERQRREANARRQVQWTAHLMICRGCRGLLSEQARREMESLVTTLRSIHAVPVIPEENVPCPEDAPGIYYRNLTDWRR